MSEKLIEALRADRKPLSPKCSNPEHTCSKSEDGYCLAYWNPEAKWRIGDCPLADMPLRSVREKKVEKVRVGQQKQKKNKSIA